MENHKRRDERCLAQARERGADHPDSGSAALADREGSDRDHSAERHDRVETYKTLFSQLAWHLTISESDLKKRRFFQNHAKRFH